MRLTLLPLWLTLSASPAWAGCEQDSLRVATFNTWGLPAPIAPNRRARLAGLEGFADELGADVVGLQEVWKGARPLVDLPGLLLGSLRLGDSGLGLASTLPAQTDAVRHFRTAGGVDRLKKKGVLRAEVEFGGEPVDVLVTHLQAGESARAADIRAAQIAEIVAFAGDGPTLLIGDLNLYDNLDAVGEARLVEAGFVDAAAAAGATEPTYRGGEHRLDRVLVRDGSAGCLAPRTARVVESELSDHHAVVVELGP